tara:strand:- start:282 stop:761 length:480 start_codon:yes stop_codon:yes gene_type:complete
VGNIKLQQKNQNFPEEVKSRLGKVGAFIKEARQARSLSIEDLSSSLRIGQEQLIALENGQEELLPESVFVKAMIRRISEKLNLDTKFIIEEYQGRKVDINKIYENSPAKPTKKEAYKIIPIMIISSGLLGLIASSFTLNYIKESTSSGPETNSTRNFTP